MNPKTMLELKDALNRELAYYQQITLFLTDLPTRFQSQSQAESAISDLMSVLEIEGTTRRLYREHIWQKISSEAGSEQGEIRLNAENLLRLGHTDTAEALIKVQQAGYAIQRQLVRVVIFLKQFNRLNQQFLRLHDTLSNPAYTGKGIVRPKPGPRHMDQEV
jgi:hypothetical protein